MCCGHRASGRDKNDQPVCVVCLGKGSKAEFVSDPSLDGRTAECNCRKTETSCPSLPFFMAMPKEPRDAYYCGCDGWN